MDQVRYLSIPRPMGEGFRIDYMTSKGGYHPPHWHEELEIMYHLNGKGEITIDGQTYPLMKKHMIVIDSRQVHSTATQDPALMFVSIHISKEYMEKYVPDLRQYQIRFTPDQINDDTFQDYMDICQMLQDLTRAYLSDSVSLSMETTGIVLQIFARLIRCFGKAQATVPPGADAQTAERIRTVISYSEKNYQNPVTLQDAADELGLSKEYFCRFFKKYMGISFMQYLSEVRACHVYQDLIATDLPVSEVMEKDGFTNQKLFNREFRRIYGCTPSSVRKNAGNQTLPLWIQSQSLKENSHTGEKNPSQ